MREGGSRREASSGQVEGCRSRCSMCFLPLVVRLPKGKAAESENVSCVPAKRVPVGLIRQPCVKTFEYHISSYFNLHRGDGDVNQPIQKFCVSKSVWVTLLLVSSS